MIGRPREALRPEPRRLSSWSRAALCPSGCSVKSPLMPKKERFGNRGKWFAACLSHIVRERPGRVLRLGRRGRPPLPNRLIFGRGGPKWRQRGCAQQGFVVHGGVLPGMTEYRRAWQSSVAHDRVLLRTAGSLQARQAEPAVRNQDTAGSEPKPGRQSDGRAASCMSSARCSGRFAIPTPCDPSRLPGKALFGYTS